MSLHAPNPFAGGLPDPLFGAVGHAPPVSAPPPLAAPSAFSSSGVWTAGLMDRVNRFFGVAGAGKRPAAGPVGPQLYLAGFGKHPGADDHDDIGVDTEQLSAVKRTLYTNGIGGNIDSGAWEKLPPDERLPKFGHEFLWDRGTWVYYGRMWYSIDAKKRDKYPMVVCAQCGSVPTDWVLSVVPPVLARAEVGCNAATSVPEVHHLIEALEATLRASAAAASADPTWATTPSADPAIANPYEFLASRPELGPDGRGLLRMMYEVDRELVGFRPGDNQSPNTTILRTSGRVRVPSCGLPPAQSAAVWVAALRPLLHPSTSILAARPLAHDWVDLIVGEPTRTEIRALLAGRKREPLATEVPYDLSDVFMTKARQTIAVQRQRPSGGS